MNDRMIYRCPIRWHPFDQDIDIIIFGSLIDYRNMYLDFAFGSDNDLLFLDSQDELFFFPVLFAVVMHIAVPLFPVIEKINSEIFIKLCSHSPIASQSHLEMPDIRLECL
jgi:hypothetical protein